MDKFDFNFKNDGKNPTYSAFALRAKKAIILIGLMGKTF